MRIRFNTGSIDYLYDATGTKLRKTVTEQQNVTVTEYLGGFQYLNAKLDFFGTAQGFVKNMIRNEVNNYFYIFTFTDHLGNVRLSYGIDPDTGQLGILEENNYYAYGLKHKNYNLTTKEYKALEDGISLENCNTCPGVKYKYNGKEWQDELSLNFYDYGARNYDSALGRWMNMDPLAEKFFSFSPYNYVMNSPIGKFDPDGMDVYFVNKKGHITLALIQDGNDILYSTYEDEIGLTHIDDWDGSLDPGTAFGGGIEVANGILSQLTGYKTDKRGYAYYSAIVDFSASNENNMLKLFHFIAKNTNVEFSMDFYTNGSNQKQIVLGTYQLDTHSPGYDTYGINNNSQIIKSYHNHPSNTNYTEDYTERKSMGDLGRYKGGDSRNAIKNDTSYPNYVFFPESTNLYNVTKYGVMYIQKINNNYKNLRQ